MSEEEKKIKKLEREILDLKIDLSMFRQLNQEKLEQIKKMKNCMNCKYMTMYGCCLGFRQQHCGAKKWEMRVW